MGKENGKRRQLTSETTGALILGLLAAVAFYVQGVPSDSGTVSPRETFLFNVVQFVLTLGFGWCLTRAASHNEFSISLKRFALSAYRRVADIDQMIDRLFSTLSRLREERGVESDHDLAIIEAIALDTKQTIRSSIADWAEIIGEELVTLQSIDQLEEERARLLQQSERSVVESALAQLDERISELADSLPAKIAAVSSARPEARSLARRPQVSVRELAGRYLAERVSGTGLMLPVRWGNTASSREYETLTVGEELVVRRVGRSALDAYDAKGRFVGRLLNRSGSSYGAFSDTLTLLFDPLQLQIVSIPPEPRRSPNDEDKLMAVMMMRVASEATPGALRFLGQPVGAD